MDVPVLRRGLCVLALVWTGTAVFCPAQAAEPPDEAAAAVALDRQRAAVARPAMWTLGAWSVANLGVGTVGALTASDPRWRSFHQGNAVWNTVNLGIAGLSLRSLAREDPGAGGLLAARRRAEALSLALAFNAGLDVAYLAAGGWLWDRGTLTDTPQQVGLGQSLVLQGGVLLVFDLTVLLAHRKRAAVRPILTATSGGALLGIGGHF